MKYLVLGSAGQIGAHLCQFLQNAGHSVLTFDIADSAAQDLRISNNAHLDQLMAESDFVYFLACDVGGSRYLARYQDTHEFILNNLKILSNTFDSIRYHGRPFIYASSQMASMSYSSYGLVKQLAEKIVKDLGGVTVKFWNVYGLEHCMDKAHVITDFIRMAQQNSCIKMLTDGTEMRQMLHADDCSKALLTLSQAYHDLPRQQQYHITSFEWTSIATIAHIVAKHFPNTTVMPGQSADLVQKDARNQADPWILQYWQPSISLEQGISSIIQQMESLDGTA